DVFAGVKGAEHRDRFNGRQGERRRHVRSDSGEPEHLDVKLLTSGFHGLQIRARIVSETKFQRMAHDRFTDFLAMGRKLVTDRRADEVRAVGIKAFLHQQIDAAEVDVTQVDCDLFGFARPIAEPVNFSRHWPYLHLNRWYMDGSRMAFKRHWSGNAGLPLNPRAEVFYKRLVSWIRAPARN